MLSVPSDKLSGALAVRLSCLPTMAVEFAAMLPVFVVTVAVSVVRSNTTAASAEAVA